MKQEALNQGRSQEVPPPGTALRRAQELWSRLDIETKTLESGEEAKLKNLSSASWIRIASGKDISGNPFVKIHIIDTEGSIGVKCIISSKGRSSFEIELAPTQITIGDFVTTLGRGNIPFHVSPRIRHEEQVMSAFVDWAKESIDNGTVTEPPYKLENVPWERRNPPAHAPQP